MMMAGVSDAQIRDTIDQIFNTLQPQQVERVHKLNANLEVRVIARQAQLGVDASRVINQAAAVLCAAQARVDEKSADQPEYCPGILPQPLRR
eukprot:SAG11_NODE_45_length_20574_cov_8.004054_7_plen_92_part_00